MNITATVRVFDHFDEITDDVDRFAKRVVQEAAVVGAAAARQAGAANHAIDIEVGEAQGDVDGYTSGIRGRWYYRFLSYGTLGSAIRPKRPGHIRSHAPGTGVTPNLMYQLARLAGRRRMVEMLRKGP